jgi:putative colanic acid biosynthesis acetyltransferase WcaF
MASPLVKAFVLSASEPATLSKSRGRAYAFAQAVLNPLLETPRTSNTTLSNHTPSEPCPDGPSNANGWRLGAFSGVGYDKGRPWPIQAAWFAVSNLIFSSWWCPRWLRPVLLRFFGAEIGTGVFIRHRVRVLWPWKLRIGSDTWIGEDVWLLNLEQVSVGSDVCLSQGAFLCTGSHDRHSSSFEYDNGPIRVGDQCWIATQAIVLRGVTVEERSVIGARAVITKDVPAGSRVAANERW